MESEASRDSLAELVAVLVADASIGSDATCPISLGKRRSCSTSEVKNFGLSIDVPVAQPRVPPTNRRSMIPSVDAFGRCVMKRTLFRADHSGQIIRGRSFGADHSGQIIRGYADHQGLGRVACTSSAKDYLESLIEPEVAFGAALGAAFGYSMIGQRPSSMSICLVGIGLSVVHGGQW
jgi:hypothetical protein